MPTKYGYSFAGWYNGEELVENGIYKTTSDMYLQARWKLNGYKIKYHLNGGVNDKNNPIVFTVASTNINLNNPTKKGYIFGGWYKTEIFNDNSRITIIPAGTTGDIDIYAMWTPVTYFVKFNVNGGSGLMSNQLFTYDVKQNLDENIYTRTGYTFLGWSDSKNDKEAKYADSLIVLNLNKQGDIVEVYAIWEANTNKITFNKGVSEGGSDEVSATYDLEMPEASAPIVPFGYEFNGYFDEEGVMYYDSSMISAKCWDKTEDTTLYARIVEKCVTITFDKQGGNGGSTSVNAIYGSTMPNAIAPEKIGYDFVGYFYQKNGKETKYYDSSMASVQNWDRDCSTSLYAYYVPKEFTITFDANNSEVEIASKVVAFDANYTLPVLTRIGYTFAGWYNDQMLYSGGIWKTASNVTLTAKWTANTDTIYTVNHYQQNINDDEYKLFATQNLTGTSDFSITPSVNIYTGFTSPATQTTIILPDGSRVIDYYYTRNCYTLTVVGNGGTNNKITQKYQSVINTTNWTSREGYTLGGLYNDLDLTLPYNDMTLPAQNKTIYAYWGGENFPSDFTYTASSYSITIISYIGLGTIVKIPSQIGGVPVTKISGTFTNQTTVVSVVIPDSVTSIGDIFFTQMIQLHDAPDLGSRWVQNNLLGFVA